MKITDVWGVNCTKDSKESLNTGIKTQDAEVSFALLRVHRPHSEWSKEGGIMKIEPFFGTDKGLWKCLGFGCFSLLRESKWSCIGGKHCAFGCSSLPRLDIGITSRVLKTTDNWFSFSELQILLVSVVSWALGFIKVSFPAECEVETRLRDIGRGGWR